MDDYQTMAITIHPDEDGFTGRECPSCEGYFKIQFGTGLKGENLPCHCSYCGHAQDHDRFWTKEQIKYAESKALHKFTGDILKMMKKLERRPNPRALFDVGITVKGKPHPIHYYREPKLEQEVTCDKCTLRYTIYGIFGFCPDCGIHNSLQILDANLKVIEKMIALAEGHEKEVADKLLDNALEDSVSALDGFGGKLCKVYASKATDPAKAEKISFQNINGVKATVLALFNIDISIPFNHDEWQNILASFQKRHLLAHNMGVIDQKYIDATGESQSIIGKKIKVTKEEVKSLSQWLLTLGTFLTNEMQKLS